MLIALMFRLLLGSAATGVATPAPAPTPDDVVITTPRAAQQKLAELLIAADGIHAVTAREQTFTFTITRDDAAYDVVATTNRRGTITGVTLVKSTADAYALGGLSWLATELDGATVTRLVADEDGAVTVTTGDGRRYMLIPGRGSGGSNAAVEARWAAAWNHERV